MDDCLFLGRVSRSIAELSKQLPKIFPPSVVPITVGSGAGTPTALTRSGSGGAVSSPALRLRVPTKTVENALLKQVDHSFVVLYIVAVVTNRD